MNYKQKLEDPRWQRRRLEIMSRDEWTCQACGETLGTLHVHHFEYAESGNPWDARDCDLVTVCRDCHRRTHTLDPILWSDGVWGRWLDELTRMPVNAPTVPAAPLSHGGR